MLIRGVCVCVSEYFLRVPVVGTLGVLVLLGLLRSLGLLDL